ncbi:MAG: DNA-binding response regulator [Rickettsiales bacterium]|nr:DNA-binding response regulator [Rickettsiales bacterium]
MSEPLAHILVVDDDTRLRELLQRFLSDKGYLITAAKDAATAERHLGVFEYDLMVLDIMMPGQTGLEFAQSKQGSLPPILFLTAMGESEQRIEGLRAGADDYLVKPFEPEELVLRIENILRRTKPEAKKQKEVQFGPYRFDKEHASLWKGEEHIYLTSSEASCMQILTTHAGEPVSREQLAEETGSQSNARSVDVQINRLRKKIEQEPGRPVYLQTVRNAGYILQTDRE